MLAQVTIPLRFLFLTAHFIAVLAVVFDLSTITAQITGVRHGPLCMLAVSVTIPSHLAASAMQVNYGGYYNSTYDQ